MARNGNVDLGDLTLAPRRSVKAESTKPQAMSGLLPQPKASEEFLDVKGNEPEREPAEAPVAQGLLATPAEKRRQTARAKAIEREDATNRLRNLKKSKDRESRHFINIPLDWETKKALEDAAHEHGLKMTVIVRDALSVYLRDAGYLR